MEAQRPLEPGEVRVFHAFTSAFSEPDAASRCRALLSDEESAREQRFRFQDDRDSYLLAHALTRSVLAELSGQPAALLRFELGPHGRPELVAAGPPPMLRFNLSHTRGLVACAVALEHDVGVDVEHVDRRVEIDQLAASVFSDAERAALQRLPEPARRNRFFQLWTLKEAYIKAVGKGLSLRLQSITLDLDGGPAPRIGFAPPVQDDGAAWWLALHPPAPAFMLAVAARIAAPSRVSVRSWSP